MGKTQEEGFILSTMMKNKRPLSTLSFPHHPSFSSLLFTPDLFQLKAYAACHLTNTLQEVTRCLPAGANEAAHHRTSSHFKPRSLLYHWLPLTSLGMNITPL